MALESVSTFASVVHAAVSKHSPQPTEAATNLIYALVDPNDNNIKYIGKTINTESLKTRYYGHLHCKDKCPRVSWLASLKAKNQKPLIEILDEVPEKEWEFWEQWWIAQFKAWGIPLKNMLSGGDGQEKGHVPWNKGKKGIYSEDTIRRIKETKAKQYAISGYRNRKLSHEQLKEILLKLEGGSYLGDLCTEYNLDYGTLSKIKKSFGRSFPKRKRPSPIKESVKVLKPQCAKKWDINTDRVVNCFFTTKLRVQEIADKYGISVETVKRKLRKRGILARKHRGRLIVSQETRSKMSATQKSIKKISVFFLVFLIELQPNLADHI